MQFMRRPPHKPFFYELEAFGPKQHWGDLVRLNPSAG